MQALFISLLDVTLDPAVMPFPVPSPQALQTTEREDLFFPGLPLFPPRQNPEWEFQVTDHMLGHPL
jgi:hypothetical protein